jgi:hypothetical protein
MLTDTQVQVLSSINDYCDSNGRLELDPAQPLPDLLAELQIPDAELYQAVGHLHELGLIEGVVVAEFYYPVVVLGLTLAGHGELP